MSRKMRLGIRLLGVGTFDPGRPGNVQGDEGVANCWRKYLLRREDVECVEIYGPTGPMRDDLDVLIHFQPNLELHAQAKNIYYVQNGYSKKNFQGGTLGVFEGARGRFAGFMYTSEKLMKACGVPGAVVPFAADPDFFTHQPVEQYRHNVSFVGNDIRGPEVNDRYFVPAIPFGLVIYGNNAWTPPLNQVCKGKLPMPDLPRLYSSSVINLNAHIDIHLEFETINLRIFEVLACQGFVLSDYMPAIEAEFGDAVAFTDGNEDEWAKIVRYMADPHERERRRKLGLPILLDRHTYEHRIRTVMDYLHEAA